MPLPLTIEVILLYLVLCAIAAFAGRHRRIGYWGFFFLSVIMTPIVTALFIFVAAPARPRRAVPKRG